MLYGEFIDELIDRLKLDKTNADLREIAGRKINLALREIGNNSNANWEHLKRNGEIIIVPNYTTGTCTITYGSHTVTGIGTIWTTSMQGRYFQPAGTSNWYKIIKVVSTTEITLLSAVVESSATSTYTIWKRFYYFPSAVRRILNMGSWIRDGVLDERSNNQIFDEACNISLVGEPTEFTMYGADPFESTYADGSVVLTNGSATVTGTGTLWLDNVASGDLLEVSSQFYRVKRVESDTSIHLFNAAKADVPSTANYTIKKDSNLGVQFFYNGNKSYIIPYTYIERVYNMVNESYDRPQLPEEFDRAILDGAEADRLSDLDDAKWINKQALYAARINDLKQTRFVSTPRSRTFAPKIPSRGKYL